MSTWSGRSSRSPKIRGLHGPRGSPRQSHPRHGLRNGPHFRPILLFFGSFQYAPNREALEYIDRVLAPSLENGGFHGEIRIAGRDIPAIASHPRVRVLGFVPDLLEAIRSADLCIVPVWHGAGVLTKVLDCMAAGVPTVLSAFAADGVPEVRDGVHAYVARDQESFPNRLIEALRSPNRWSTMAASARELIETHYSWESQKARVEVVLRVAMKPLPKVTSAIPNAARPKPTA